MGISITILASSPRAVSLYLVLMSASVSRWVLMACRNDTVVCRTSDNCEETQ